MRTTTPPCLDSGTSSQTLGFDRLTDPSPNRQSIDIQSNLGFSVRGNRLTQEFSILDKSRQPASSTGFGRGGSVRSNVNILAHDFIFVINMCLLSAPVVPVQPEQRERLVQLAAKVAVENDPVKFHALLTELSHLLSTQPPPPRANGKTLTEPPAR